MSVGAVSLTTHTYSLGVMLREAKGAYINLHVIPSRNPSGNYYALTFTCVRNRRNEEIVIIQMRLTTPSQQSNIRQISSIANLGH